jgi:hypothetical protein
MRRAHLLISAAWLMQGAAWFLPVVTSIGGLRIDPIPGWGAFLAASTAFWPHTDSLFSTWYESLFATASVGTTVFFFVGSTWALLRGSHSLRRGFGWAAAIAFLVNSHWYVRLSYDGLSGLGIGYFLWWWSFVMLAIGLLDLAGRNDAAEFTHSQASPLPRQLSKPAFAITENC